MFYQVAAGSSNTGIRRYLQNDSVGRDLSQCPPSMTRLARSAKCSELNLEGTTLTLFGGGGYFTCLVNASGVGQEV